MNNWHKVALNCSKCDTPLTIMEVDVSYDEIRLDCCCVKCGTELWWVSSYAKMQYGCLAADLQEEIKPPKAVRPPVKQLPPPNQKENDDKLLRDSGIDPGGSE